MWILTRRPHNDGLLARRIHRVGKIDRGSHRLGQTIVAEVAHDADDGRVWLAIPSNAETPSDRIRSAEAAGYHLLVDEDYRIERVAIRFGEPASPQQSDTDRLEVIRRHILVVRIQLLTGLRLWRPLDPRLGLQVPAAERNSLRRRHHRHARLAAESLEQLIEERLCLRAGGVLRTGKC